MGESVTEKCSLYLINLLAGGSIPYSSQNAHKQTYLTNYMWYGIKNSATVIGYFLANGRQHQLVEVGLPHTSRHMREYQMTLPSCHGYCSQGKCDVVTHKLSNIWPQCQPL